VTAVKNNGKKKNQFNAKENVDATEYQCTIANCNCHMHFYGPKKTEEAGLTGLVSLQVLGTHYTHQLQGWLGQQKRGRKAFPPYQYVKWMVPKSFVVMLRRPSELILSLPTSTITT
jgi:hypothetical protein